ncbi:MAG: DUF2442 domain-containing protein [Myxococcaceae bacterium]|nr:DUF2442 domain-containing protein [Myxococcaceae bacterium]MBH2006006.1 DUF2442 domain-containing protein [Myxococcaceae bacterium]
MENYRIAIEFKDGLKGVLDLSKLVMSHDAGVFTALRDQALFHQAYLDHGAVTWPGELDLAPDAMYDSIKKRHQYLHF